MTQPVVSGPPPAGTVTVKGVGWRFNVPLALVFTVLGAIGTRLWSIEQRALEQARTIDTLTAELHACQQSCPRSKP